MLRIASVCAVTLLVASASAAAQTPLERGSYLVNSVGACSNCHTPRVNGQPDLSKLLSGGFQVFDEPTFVVKGANGTPDRETGIGAWSDDGLKHALRTGMHPNGTQLATVMPYPFYGVITEGDMNAIVAYLRSIPAIRNQVQTPVYKAQQIVVPYPGADKPMTQADLSDPVKRGFYLSSIAHCMACHSRASEGPPDFKSNFGKGGREFRTPAGVAKTANISSHPTAGLGAWSDAELRRVLTEGISRDGRKLKPPMIDYVAYYKTWSDADLSALIAWIRSIPPIE
jgi:mono/diheme cytochrome c family protein